MDEYIVKQGKKLRIGYTTGTCAATAAKAATRALFTDEFPCQMEINVPAGKIFEIAVLDRSIEDEYAQCGVEKDGGDDPDVTNGMLIYARVSKLEECKIEIEGGEGIGRVTKNGLACKVGGPAINPVPEKMIKSAVLEEMRNANYQGGMKVIIFAPQGEEIAKKTFNARLGILGGISILGTTGVVEPMSEDALIDTIKTEMHQHDRTQVLFASPGNYGVDFAKVQYELDMEQSVKYSNYLGEFIDHAIYCGFGKILLIGHIGKMIKIAAGVMNTHSKVADARVEVMVSHSAICGVKKHVLTELMEAVTTDEMHEILIASGRSKEVYESIGHRIQFQLDYRAKGKIEIAFIAFSNAHGLLIESEKAGIFIEEIKKTVK